MCFNLQTKYRLWKWFRFFASVPDYYLSHHSPFFHSIPFIHHYCPSTTQTGFFKKKNLNSPHSPPLLWYCVPMHTKNTRNMSSHLNCTIWMPDHRVPSNWAKRMRSNTTSKCRRSDDWKQPLVTYTRRKSSVASAICILVKKAVPLVNICKNLFFFLSSFCLSFSFCLAFSSGSGGSGGCKTKTCE